MLGAALGPTLRRICDGRLGEIEWFRSTWQQGGAATGWSTWTSDGHEPLRVMVKIPVGPTEYSWTMRLGGVAIDEWESPRARSLPSPRVIAAGETLGGYDLAWLVIERFEGSPLTAELDGSGLGSLLETVARFHALAREHAPVNESPALTDWQRLIDKSRALIPDCGIDQPQSWNAALRRVQRILPSLVDRWRARQITTWCHGDVHPGNAMHRAGDRDTLVLIDLALVHPGHWVEDALYLERLFWGHKHRLDGVDPVADLARARAAIGLGVGGKPHDLARIRRVMMAACVPVFLAREGNPAYVRRALEHIEQLVPQLA